MTLALLLALHAPTALAAKGTEVAVVGVHVAGMGDDAALAAAWDLADALERTGRILPVEPGEVRARLSGREDLVVSQAFLGPGRDALARGRVLYERADFEGAIPLLESAVEQLTDGMAAAPESKDLIDALLLLGLAEASIGEVDAARAAYKQVVVLDTSRELDPVNYPPKIVALFDEVRQDVLRAPAGRLVVQAETGAIVHVDGMEQGEAPMVVNGLPPGVHYVLVVGEGGRRSFAAVDLGPGERVEHAPLLDQRALVDAAPTADGRALQTSQLYGALGAHVATGLVLLGGETGDGDVALQLYEPRTGNFSKPVNAEAGGDPVGSMLDLVPTLAAYVSDAGTLRTDRVSPAVSSLDISDNALLVSMLLDPEPIVETVTVTQGPPWYLWAGAGAVAAGGATAGVVLLTRNAAGEHGTIIVGPMP